MNKFILILVLILTSAVEAATKEQLSKCEAVSTLAGGVMSSRLNLVDINDAINATNGNGIAMIMVKDAYSRPNYQTESMKRIAINEFKTKYYLSCYKITTKGE